MRIGIAINDTWAFFDQVYEEFKSKYPTELFTPKTISLPLFQERLNRKNYQQQLTAFLRQNNVVFFEWAGEYLAQATALPKTCAIVTRLHRYELYQWAQHINWSKVDRLILVSNAKKEEIEQLFPQLQGKTTVIPEGIPLEKFPFLPHTFEKRLGILSHLTPRKRVYELILAFAENNLASEGYSLHIGGGEHPKFKDYYQSILYLIAHLDMQDNIILHNHVTDPQSWFQQIDIFISNSYSEGLQVSPMEAMASGCYCLSHTWAGAGELLPAENLFTTNRELSNKIRLYASMNAEQQLEERKKLRKTVEDNFDIKIIGHKILLEVETAGKNYL